MLQLAVAHSDDVDAAGAADELIEQCRAQAREGSPPRAALLFAPWRSDHQVLVERIRRAYPGVALIGCTTDGQVTSRLAYRQDSVALALFCGERLTCATGLARQVSADPVGASERAAREALERLGGPARLCVILPESMTTSGVRLLEGLRRGLGDEVPIVGGLATDDWRFESTRQFHGVEVLGDSLPLLLLGGPLLVSHGVASGWKPQGPVSRVTRAEDNTVFEIDGRPALELYRRYLGEHMAPSGQNPLAVHDEDDGFYLRAPLTFDPETGSVSFGGDVPTGSRVQLAEASRVEITAACRRSVESALESYPGRQPAAALFFSCAARRQLLGTLTRRELQTVQALVPPQATLCGMYAYGEFAPLRPGGPARFHNQTFVTTFLGTE